MGRDLSVNVSKTEYVTLYVAKKGDKDYNNKSLHKDGGPASYLAHYFALREMSLVGVSKLGDIAFRKSERYGSLVSRYHLIGDSDCMRLK